jgi:TPR repeat protein
MRFWLKILLVLCALWLRAGLAAEPETGEVCDLKTAAEKGDLSARAQLILKFCNHQPHDYVEAAQMLMVNARDGDSDSADMLGQLYRSGEGVTKNYLESVLWLKKAVELGNIYAQYHLGLRYEAGEGVQQDYVEAYFWYVTSAALQFNDGFRALTMQRRDQIEKKLSPEQVAEVQSRSEKWVEGFLKKQAQAR